LSIYTVYITFDDRSERQKYEYITAAEDTAGAVDSVKRLWNGIRHYYHPKAQNIEYDAHHVADLPYWVVPSP